MSIQRRNPVQSLVISTFLFLVNVLSNNVTARLMYWTDQSGGIRRASTDGSNMEYVLGTNAGLGIAIDQQQGKIYFSTWGNPPIKDKIQRANLDGSYVEDIVIFDDPTSFPRQICLDLAVGKIYWPDSWYDIIYRANLDGSEVQEILTGLDGPYGLALDLSASKIYWADCFSGKIRRANLDGTNVEDVLTNLGGLRSLAIDEEAGKLYWSRLRFLPDGGDIGRVNLNGTDAETQLVTGLGYSVITLDTYAHKMYWTEIRAYEYGTGMIRRANLDGSNIEVLLTGLSKPTAIAIIPEAATIYVPDDYSTIQAAVDAASPGDSIIVRDDTYTENVDVNKDHLTIRSENGAARTIVQGNTVNSSVFSIRANAVTLDGFTITEGYNGLHLTTGRSHCIISNNIVNSNQEAGILIQAGAYNKINKNILSKNVHGIWLDFTDDNVVAHNIIKSNAYGVTLGGGGLLPYPENNFIYLNNFLGNSNNIWLFYPDNFLNSLQEITYTYDSKTYTNYLGNYWDDYSGTDSDRDGIGDSPYTINSYEDNYPLMMPFENYEIGGEEPPEMWLKVAHTPLGIWRLRENAGLQEDVLMIVPNDWVLKLVSENSQTIEKDGYIWWNVENPGDGVVGWMAARESDGSQEYLVPGDLEKAEELYPAQEPQQVSETVPVIVEAVHHYYNNDDIAASLYSSDDSDNSLSMFKDAGFPIELVLAIMAQESRGTWGRQGGQGGDPIYTAFNNALRTWDGGYGIMQITTSGFKGRGSHLDVYEEECAEFRRVWIGNYMSWFPEHLCNWYTNTRQGIYANIKDGLRALQDKYATRPKTSEVF